MERVRSSDAVRRAATPLRVPPCASLPALGELLPPRSGGRGRSEFGWQVHLGGTVTPDAVINARVEALIGGQERFVEIGAGVVRIVTGLALGPVVMATRRPPPVPA